MIELIGGMVGEIGGEMINYPSKDSYICSDIFFQLQKVDTKCSRKKITDCRSKNNTMVLFFLHLFVGHSHDLYCFFKYL